jgi:hypothetical protein
MSGIRRPEENAYGTPRDQRVGRMWERFVALWREQHPDEPDAFDLIVTTEGRMTCLRQRLRDTPPRGWHFESAIEAADVGLDDQAAQGLELWHPGDQVEADRG